jgi:hypothetical protein
MTPNWQLSSNSPSFSNKQQCRAYQHLLPNTRKATRNHQKKTTSSSAKQLPRVQLPHPYPHGYNTCASACLNQAILLPPIQCFPIQHGANLVIDQVTSQSYKYRHIITGKATTTEVWTQLLANEFGQLANGIGTHVPEDSNTIFFINCNQVPTDG